jgi:N-acetyl-anhydromuramyl-L-alanine amidase AmpD
MSPQYVFYWIAVGNKKLPIEKVEWKKLYTKYKTLYIK